MRILRFCRWVWNALGHVFRVKTIGDLFGWWEQPWWAKLVAVLISAVLTLWEWVSRRNIPETITLLVLLLAIAWAVLQSTRRLSTKASAHNPDAPLQAPSQKLAPILSDKGPGNVQVAAWTDFSTLYVVGVENIQTRVQATARNVRARLEYRHADGIDRFVVEPAGWVKKRPEWAATCFEPSVDLPSGTMEKVILAGTNEERRVRTLIVGRNGIISASPGYDLTFGYWEVDGLVQGDNCKPLNIAYSFSIANDGTLKDLALR